jgi:hypothetical protein
MKLYNNTGKIYMRGYGHVPFEYTEGGSIGDVAYEVGKTGAKVGFKMFKKVWGNLTPEAKDAMIDYGISKGEQVASRAGRAIQSRASALGSAAQDKLEGLLGKSEATSRISRESEKMIKKLVKSGKKAAKSKLKKANVANKLPKSVSSQLSKSQQQKLNDTSVNMLSKLLSGSGMRLLK